MAAEGLHHYCRHLGLSPRDPSGPRTVDLGVCNNDGGLRPPSIILYYMILSKKFPKFNFLDFLNWQTICYLILFISYFYCIKEKDSKGGHSPTFNFVDNATLLMILCVCHCLAYYRNLPNSIIPIVRSAGSVIVTPSEFQLK